MTDEQMAQIPMKTIDESMDVTEYQQLINLTAVFPREIGVLYCALGISDEAGEVAGKIKKFYRDKPHLVELHEDLEKGQYMGLQGPVGTEYNEFKDALSKELGDVLWYITALANEFNISLNEVMVKNYNKLIKRRQTNTLHGDGDNREEVA